MKCPRCGGSGKYMREVGGYRPCEYCNGTGKIVQTNEEWFCGLSAKEKAKVLNDTFWKCLNYVDEHELVDDDISEIYLRWLKEKHHDSVQG